MLYYQLLNLTFSPWFIKYYGILIFRPSIVCLHTAIIVIHKSTCQSICTYILAIYYFCTCFTLFFLQCFSKIINLNNFSHSPLIWSILFLTSCFWWMKWLTSTFNNVLTEIYQWVNHFKAQFTIPLATFSIRK